MVICNGCFTQNRTGALYCAGCGEALIRMCQGCNASLREGAKFCHRCAEPVTDGREVFSLCPSCSAPNRLEALYCGKCRFALKQPCTNCGALNRGGATFCYYCGTSLTKIPKSSSPILFPCDHCGKGTRPGANFCQHCGLPPIPLTTNDARQFSTGMLPKMHRLIGSEGDEYLVIELIAKGGMGAVYKVLRYSDKTTWALKEMSETVIDGGDYEQTIAAFRSEAEILETLDHENLPKVIDVFEYEHRQYLVMDLVEGYTLSQLMEKNGSKIDEAAVIDWAKQLCIVLSYLHSRKPPVIYRDLKPDNVMVESASGRVKLIDFGIARRFRGGKSSDTILLGTHGYAAPEQYGKKGQSDARTDIFALGATLHHLLTGIDPSQRPWNFEPIKKYNSSISTRVCEAIDKAVNGDRVRRPASAAQMYKAMTGKTLPRPKKAKAKPASKKKKQPSATSGSKKKSSDAGASKPPLPVVLVQELGLGSVARGEQAVASLAISVPTGEVKVRSKSSWLDVQPEKAGIKTAKIKVTADTKNLGFDRGMRKVTYKPSWVVDWLWWLLLWLLYANARPFVPMSKNHVGKVLVGGDEVDVSVEVIPPNYLTAFGWAISGFLVAAELAIVMSAVLLLA